MKIVKVMRERRTLWARDENTKGQRGARQTKRTSGMTSDVLKNMDLDDIMLDDD